MVWNPAIHQTMTEAEFAAGKIAPSDQGKRIGSDLENHDSRLSTVEGSQRADALAVVPRELPPFGMSVMPEWYWKIPIEDTINGKQGVAGETFITGGLLVPRNDTDFAWALFASKTGKIKVGSYVGDGSVGHVITGVGFQPDALIIWKNGSESSGFGGFFTTKDAVAEAGGILTIQFEGAGNQRGGQIQSLDSDGFTLNTAGDPNASSITYNYLALKITSAATLNIDVGTYTGSGGSQSISGLGFTPQLVIATVNANQNDGSKVGNACRSHETSGAGATWAIALTGDDPVGSLPLEIESDGFKVRGSGSDEDMDDNGSLYIYIALAGGAITM